MNENEKYAYRKLLYLAILDFRMFGTKWSRDLPDDADPQQLVGYLQNVRGCAAVAEWLHEMATFAATDFDGFSPERFWKEYTHLCNRLPEPGMHLQYRLYFEQDVSEGPPVKQPGVQYY